MISATKKDLPYQLKNVLLQSVRLQIVQRQEGIRHGHSDFVQQFLQSHVRMWNLTETKISRTITEKHDLQIAARQFSPPGCPRSGSGRPGWGRWLTEENKNKVAFIFAA